jgi:hypothetical protein
LEAAWSEEGEKMEEGREFVAKVSFFPFSPPPPSSIFGELTFVIVVFDR